MWRSFLQRMRTLSPAWWLVGLGAFFFLPFLGGVHLFDWDEINFAEMAREMILLEDYLQVRVRFQPFWEKPPLFLWMQASAMHLFGVGEYGARFPNAICGVLTLVLLFRMGRFLYDDRFGWYWALAYLGSILPHLYFKSGIIDPWFNLWIMGGLWYWMLGDWKKQGLHPALNRPVWHYTLVGGLLLGLAILTKGQVAGVIVGIVAVVYWISQRFRWYLPFSQWVLFFGISLLPFGLWVLAISLNGNPEFLSDFLTYQIRLLSTEDAGHGGFPGYHVVVLLVGCFPASIFALRTLFRHKESGFQGDALRWMRMLFWVVLILFSLVQSKIVHYSSLCYFPLTYLAAAVNLYRLEKGELNWKKWQSGLLIGIGGLFVLVIGVAPWLGNQPELLKRLIQGDAFVQGNLDAQVNWTGWEMLPAIGLLALLVISLRGYLSQAVWRTSRTLFMGMAGFVMLTLIFFVGRAEHISQRAAIAYFESLQGKDVYVLAFSYKSYAPEFYARSQPPTQAQPTHDINWLLYGEIDKDLYISTKVHKLPALTPHVKDIEEIGRKNGFVFFLRRKKTP
ncbi:MAG: glycosyltransferase family 39 protein [Bacteroidota bacterium]